MAGAIATALISVSDKEGLEEFARFLAERNVKLLSTGGTAEALRKAGLEVTDISDHTGFPEIMDGRVKTLHPKVHGGILGKREDKSHVKAMEEHDITPIDMVVVNLYPFEETVKKDGKFEECIENIDIGGPSMIRSAAKNFADVAVVTEPRHYRMVMDEMDGNDGAVGDSLRQLLAKDAFAKTASYDAAIYSWLAEQRIAADDAGFPGKLFTPAALDTSLRYGENPHQKAAIYLSEPQPSVAHAKQLQGKELSFNNISDAEAALELVSEFTAPAAAIIKHANPCGVARAGTLGDAYEKALHCDPVSAYGSIVAFNQKLDEKVAEKLADKFIEVIIAPEINEAAQNLLSKKKNLRLLVTGKMPDPARKDRLIRSITGGLLVQERDWEKVEDSALDIVTKRKPSEEEIKEMLFAFAVCKHVKSNAIVFTKDLATVGIGAGQMSRVDSVRIAASKAGALEGEGTGFVMASDAFLPFADGVTVAAEAGVSCIIQPGGSIRDDEVIEAADKHNIAMAFTGTRHFKH